MIHPGRFGRVLGASWTHYLSGYWYCLLLPVTACWMPNGSTREKQGLLAPQENNTAYWLHKGITGAIGNSNTLYYVFGIFLNLPIVLCHWETNDAKLLALTMRSTVPPPIAYICLICLIKSMIVGKSHASGIQIWAMDPGARDHMGQGTNFGSLQRQRGRR